MKDILHEEYYFHFSTLHCAMRILLNLDDTQNKYMDFENCFVILLPKPKEFMDTASVYNIYNLLHLADDCQNLRSSLNEIRAFKYVLSASNKKIHT